MYGLSDSEEEFEDDDETLGGFIVLDSDDDSSNSSSVKRAKRVGDMLEGWGPRWFVWYAILLAYKATIIVVSHTILVLPLHKD